jgi:hypothetical protein
MTHHSQRFAHWDTSLSSICMTWRAWCTILMTHFALNDSHVNMTLPLVSVYLPMFWFTIVQRLYLLGHMPGVQKVCSLSKKKSEDLQVLFNFMQSFRKILGRCRAAMPRRGKVGRSVASFRQASRPHSCTSRSSASTLTTSTDDNLAAGGNRQWNYERGACSMLDVMPERERGARGL